jgi:hypothetical protein
LWDYGSLARPLTNLLHHKVFSWTDAAQVAFDKLKQAMSTTLVLAFSNFSKEFVVETDACETGIGAVLSQEGHPIVYFSKGLSVNNQKLSIYEKKFLAVLMTVDKWRSYLHKNSFVIRMNYQSLSSARSNIIYWSAEESYEEVGRILIQLLLQKRLWK